MKAKMFPNVPELQEQYREGRISRRGFIRLAALLGVSMSGINGFLASCAAPSPQPGSTPVPQPSSTPVPQPSSTPVPTPTLARSPTPALTPTPTGPYGELTVGQSTFGFELFDPIKGTRPTNENLLMPMFDFLIRTDPSEKVSTGIAERWEMAPDGLSWTFYIRKGITFHDGSALTAKDVKFSLDRYASKEAYHPDIRNAHKSVEVLDDYTVRVNTNGVQPYFHRYVNFVPGNQGMILPKDYFEKVGADYFNLHPVGTGPFKFVRRASGDMVEYEALDKHYRQVPAFKKLTLLLIPEETTRLAMLKTGALDAIDISIDSGPTLEAAGFRTANLAGTAAAVIFFGAYDPRCKGLPIADIRVRQALSLAINRDEIGRTLLYGKMLPPTAPNMWPDQPEIDVPYWSNEAAKVYRYDPGEAKRLLEVAGYAQGFTIKLYSYQTGGGAYVIQLASVLQGYWLRLGVKTEIVPTDIEAFRALRRSGPNKGPADQLVGAATTASAGGYEVPSRALSTYFWSEGTNDLISGTIGQNPELDRLIPAALAEPNEAKRFELNARALRLAMDTHVYSSIGTVPALAGLGHRVDIDFPKSAASITKYVEAAKRRKQ